MDELEEWCDNGIEMSPADMISEEIKAGSEPLKQSLTEIKSFNSAHGAEMELIHEKLSKSITDYAKLLMKFDQANPAFTKNEAVIMKALLKKPKSGSGLVLHALGKSQLGAYDDSADKLQEKVSVFFF
jgi:hypothetical protein